MYSRFKLNEIKYSDFKEYEKAGHEYYNKTKKNLQNDLEKFIGEDGVIDGTKLQQNWFPTNCNFHIFMSHSHNDEKLAISLAGFLKEKLSLETFIDSCLWGYSNNLLKKIDNKYCKHSNGESYNYNKRNYSTSHVHMMLSIALSKMIDNCEAIFFLNTKQSISLSKEIEGKKTSSPWIYSELSVSDMIRSRPINDYRNKPNRSAKSESIDIEYDVNNILNKFSSLSSSDLKECAQKWKKNDKNYKNALDYIYDLKTKKYDIFLG